jgi:hypothetical protein
LISSFYSTLLLVDAFRSAVDGSVLLLLDEGEQVGVDLIHWVRWLTVSN